MRRRSHLPRRRLLGSALSGLAAAMTGCGKDQTGARPWLLPQSPPERGAGTPLGTAGAGGADPEDGSDQMRGIAAMGPLEEAGEAGVRVPRGYSVRVVARTGQAPTPSSSYLWHGWPDGGATFEASDGGWLYASNSELNPGGGVGVLRFDSRGEVVDAYSVLTKTRKNCQGCATPQGTWLSCEEVEGGIVYETDPFGEKEPIARPLLGAFTHEGATYHPNLRILYLTEDLPDGCFYRFISDASDNTGFADLSSGTLQVAELKDGRFVWHNVPDPTISQGVLTRYQVEQASTFDGGEGVWQQGNSVYFSTKGDDRIWEYDLDSDEVTVLYDRLTAANPILTGVDDIVGTSAGELLIAEDGGDMQVVAILPDGNLKAIAQVDGHRTSEVTGLAFDPSGKRLYFSSQRGVDGNGVTYEMSGPFV